MVATKLLTFVNKHKTEVVSSGVFLVDFSECGCKVKPSKEESDRNGLSS